MRPFPRAVGKKALYNIDFCVIFIYSFKLFFFSFALWLVDIDKTRDALN